jgi:hypothetical protein
MKVISDSGWLTGAGCGSATQLSLMDLGSRLREAYGEIATDAVPEALAAAARQLDRLAHDEMSADRAAEISDRPGNLSR